MISTESFMHRTMYQADAKTRARSFDNILRAVTDGQSQEPEIGSDDAQARSCLSFLDL
jgi:hypothetical protein